MKSLSFKQRLAASALVILLALFLLRPGASRLKFRIIASISAGVGRPIDISSVHVRILPRPGFDLENLVVYDDPSFGAEPMLRASEVTADLRISSLLKGRIEISRLNLTEPSLNLVHRGGGGWNLEALLERTARIPMAPTGINSSAPRPHFPYIEGSSGRINFKSGPEKRPYALIDADFSLWQDSDNVWGVRVKALPFRTDLNLTDVGQLQINGTWQRAQTFQETPLQVNLEWNKAQLGQVTKFFTGADKGWRGNIQFDAALRGSPQKLKITTTASIDDFRRYDIATGNSLRLAAHCDGEYSTQTHEFDEVLCGAPVGNGLLTFTGDIGLPGSRHYDVTLKADNVPMSAALTLAQRMKKNIPDDLTADGILLGMASIKQDPGPHSQMRFSGDGEIADMHLSSAAAKAEFGPATLPFVVVDDSVQGKRLARNASGMIAPKGPHIEVGPVSLSGTRNGSAMVRGWANGSGYDLAIVGESEIPRTLRFARMFGLPALSTNAEGTAQLNLQIAGLWMGAAANGTGFRGPLVTGSTKLRNSRFAIPGTSEAVDISSAEVQLSEDGVRIRKLNARAAGANWTGTIDAPRGCGLLDACALHFALNTDTISLGQIENWATGRTKSRPWYQVLESAGKPAPSVLSRLHASGQIVARRFVVHEIPAENVSAKVSIDAGKLQVSDFEADVFGGKHQGDWIVDFTRSPSVCNGSGSVRTISLASIAHEMRDDWITGTANGSYELKGACTAEFWQAADGAIRVEMRNGTLPHVLLGEDSASLKISRLTGEARLRSGVIEVGTAKLDSPSGSYKVSGTVSLKRQVDLKLARMPGEAGPSGYEITGTLATPRVSTLSNSEQARLKSLPPK